YSVASFYHWFSLEPRPGTLAHVCDDVSCKGRGAEALCRSLESALPRGSWQRSPCLGLCERGPAALVVRSGERPAALPVTSLKEMIASRLVGRGGAAFSTGRKWAAVFSQKVRPHLLVCNADESEPGTFKDRILLEEDPYSVIEGMAISALATGCEKGYVYLRA